ncbi:MAG TPA: hypothetical protein VNO30_29030 [Kofleriaceae bacterium]|nr:hypothetical protein [Kofleriaceae bacterium]
MADEYATHFDDLLGTVDESLHGRSGSVFYSGRRAFAVPAKLYMLGLNPGGNPITQREQTIARNIEALRLRDSWSAYADESWRNRPAGTHGMQPRVLHLLRRLNLEPRLVPASNVVFVRTAREADLSREKEQFLPLCWKIHAAVIERLGVRVVTCFGRTAGSWVREQMGAHEQVDEFIEQNGRRWSSHAHAASDGRRVVTLTHPSIADWTNPKTDPTPLVERALQKVA